MSQCPGLRIRPFPASSEIPEITPLPFDDNSFPCPDPAPAMLLATPARKLLPLLRTGLCTSSAALRDSRNVSAPSFAGSASCSKPSKPASAPYHAWDHTAWVSESSPEKPLIKVLQRLLRSCSLTVAFHVCSCKSGHHCSTCIRPHLLYMRQSPPPERLPNSAIKRIVLLASLCFCLFCSRDFSTLHHSQIGKTGVCTIYNSL